MESELQRIYKYAIRVYFSRLWCAASRRTLPTSASCKRHCGHKELVSMQWCRAALSLFLSKQQPSPDLDFPLLQYNTLGFERTSATIGNLLPTLGVCVALSLSRDE